MTSIYHCGSAQLFLVLKTPLGTQAQTHVGADLVSLCNLRPAVLFWLHLLGLERELDLHSLFCICRLLLDRHKAEDVPLDPVRQAVIPESGRVSLSQVLPLSGEQ